MSSDITRTTSPASIKTTGVNLSCPHDGRIYRASHTQQKLRTIGWVEIEISCLCGMRRRAPFGRLGHD
jgi:hypothetical protein